MKLLIFACCTLVMFSVATVVDGQSNASPATLRRLADDYYNWRNQQFPVASSDSGLHTWDNKLTDYSPAALAARRAHNVSLLAQGKAMRTHKWKKDDQIDWLLLRAQLETP